MQPTTDLIAELCRTVQALSRPVEDQRRLFPAMVSVTDELASDFDDALRDVGGVGSALFGAEQSAPLETLHALLEKLSGPGHAEVWTDEALRSDARWAAVREAARDVLRAFAWPEEQPLPGSAIYVDR